MGILLSCLLCSVRFTVIIEEAQEVQEALSDVADTTEIDWWQMYLGLHSYGGA